MVDTTQPAGRNALNPHTLFIWCSALPSALGAWSTSSCSSHEVSSHRGVPGFSPRTPTGRPRQPVFDCHSAHGQQQPRRSTLHLRATCP